MTSDQLESENVIFQDNDNGDRDSLASCSYQQMTNMIHSLNADDHYKACRGGRLYPSLPFNNLSFPPWVVNMYVKTLITNKN